MTPGNGAIRGDAMAKIAGSAAYAADISPSGLCELAVVRSPVPHARFRHVDVRAAAESPGVLRVVTGADIGLRLWGRRMRDVPVLALNEVRYVGEPVAAVIAESRRAADRAVALVDVDYEPLAAVFDPEVALEADSPAVHPEPWTYAGAAVPAGAHNLQSDVEIGDWAAVDAALATSPYVVDRRYTTPRGHQGYIEPQACVAEVRPDGRIHLWVANKSPYRLRTQLAACLGVEADRIVIEPVMIGGDFGGKGAPLLAPLCILASSLVGRPVRAVLRYNEDLTAANPRHSAVVHVRAGCDLDGRLTAMAVDTVFDGGAYAGYKPLPDVNLHGALEAGNPYRLPAHHVRSRIAYTNSVPSGHMRSPGSPQVVFAVESAIDELAQLSGVDPADFRRDNLLTSAEVSRIDSTAWPERRAVEVLEAALKAYTPLEGPWGWATGRGIAVYDRVTRPSPTSIHLEAGDGDTILVEVPFPETGTGSHTATRAALASALGVEPQRLVVRQAATDRLPEDPGVGGSWVTAALAEAAQLAAEAWRSGGGAPVTVTGTGEGTGVIGHVTQIAQVAVDLESGELRVLQLLTALDVGEILNPVAHRLQIEGGAAMGFGFATMEDLDVREGQVWAGTLGEFRLPSTRDVPLYRTVLLPGSQGLGVRNVKGVGELSNVPTAAAVANAVAAACGIRVRALPISAEQIWRGRIRR